MLYSIEKKQSDWFSLTLVAKKLNFIQLPELTARSPVNARFQLGFRAASLSIAVCIRAASNELRIATEHDELTRKGPRKQSKIFGIPVSLI